MAAYLKITEQIDQALDLAKQNTFRLNYICWGQLAIWKHIWLLSVPHFSGIINYEKKKKKKLWYCVWRVFHKEKILLLWLPFLICILKAKKYILSSFAHIDAVPNPHNFLSSTEHQRTYFEKCLKISPPPQKKSLEYN